METKSTQENCTALEEEEEEEAPSLSDLPVNLMKEETKSRTQDGQVQSTEADEEEEDFDFRSWGVTQLRETEMCVADEVFFRGQILPWRLSVSSDSGLITPKYSNVSHRHSWCEPRSESMDHGFSGEFTSNSSRSNSIGSSSASSTATTQCTTRNSKPRIRNQFHTYPSPKPQLRNPNFRQASLGSHSRKSSTWDFFRLGVVPAPEIGLQDLKVRSNNGTNNNSASRNSSSSGSSNSNFKANKSTKNGGSANHSDKSNRGLKQVLGENGALLGGCKCSVETVPSSVVVIKSNGKGVGFCESASARALKEKAVEWKKQKQSQKQGKQAMSRRRTFEWLKELSHASYPDDEALLCLATHE